MIKKIFLILIMGIFLLPTLVALAADDLSYTVLAPLPCIDGSGTPGTDGYKPECNQTANQTTLEKYLPGAFKLAIGLSAVFAVLMIVIGGFQYISSDAIMKKTEGKERIKNAVFGLVLVISAWLILNTINPNLLNINLNIESISTTAVNGGTLGTNGGTLGTISKAGVPMTKEEIDASNIVRASLYQQGVDTYRGPCTDGRPVGCVNLNGLTNTTKDGLILTKKALTESGCNNCNMIITGGTEPGIHSSTGDHSKGNAVDLKPDPGLNTALGFPTPKEGDTKTKVFKVDGKPDITAVFKYEILGGNAGGTSTGNHWHVSFK